MVFFLVLVLLLQSFAKAQCLSFRFPGTSDQYFRGNAILDFNQITFPASNFSQAFYALSVSRMPLLFDASFVFRTHSDTGRLVFLVAGTSPNYPVCYADPLYPCDPLQVAFSFADHWVSVHGCNASSSKSNFRFSTNATVNAWVEYHLHGAPHSVRVYVAENTNFRPSTPITDFSCSITGGYFFQGLQVLETNDIVIVSSWSFSTAGAASASKGLNLYFLAIAGPFVIAGVALSIFRTRRRQLMKKKVLQRSALLAANIPINYTFKELRSATADFKEVLGRGGTSTVYKGFLQNTPTSRIEVAVKDLQSNSPDHEAEQQFREELNMISRVRHQNLVALQGWCHEHDKLLLVYECMSKGSLDKVLFTSTSGSTNPLSWNQRFNIIRCVAEALRYLHEGLEKRIVHRDIKAANVLLDERMTAKVGDFGLARLMQHTIGSQTMTRAGTLGYISPELAYSGRATEKSDVYSFGILVLEIVAGRRAVDHRFAGDTKMVLLEWAGTVSQPAELVDPRIQDGIDMKQVERVIQLALRCCSWHSEERPTMRLCCQILSGESELPNLPLAANTDIPEDYDSKSSLHSASNASDDVNLNRFHA